MSTRPHDTGHDELEALIAADALDGLDDAQRRHMEALMATHGPDCVECRRLTSEYAEVAAALAATVEPIALAAGAEEALMRSARAATESKNGVTVIHGEPPAPRRTSTFRTRADTAQGRAQRWVVAAAIAAAIALIAGVAGYWLAPRRGPDRSGQFVAFASQPGTRFVAFPPRGDQQLAVAFHEGERQGWVFGTDLPALPGDRVYELWFRTDPTAPMQPAGTFLPSDGTVLSTVNLGQPIDAVAVSVEPQGGSPQPTTEPIFLTSV